MIGNHKRILLLCLLAVPAGIVEAQNGHSFLDADSSLVPYTRSVRSPALSCEELVSQANYDYSIVSSRPVSASADIREHCRVSGVIAPEIHFQVNLPSAWNGRFYMHGNGGFAGLPPGNPNRARIRDRALQHGFATAYTDTGHDGRVEPLGTFAYNNRQKEIDYAFRAVHLTAITAKELIGIYYGEKASFAYWDGCSTGGRQGLMSAQRFPEDFDGIIVGAPVLNFTGTMLSYLWNAKALQEGPIDQEKLKLVADAIYQRCDSLDGLKDGLIEDPRECSFNPAKDLPRCHTGTDKKECFTESEVETLQRIYDGVRPKGELLFPGQPLGAEAEGVTGRGLASGWDRWILNREGPSIQQVFMETFLKYLAFPEDDPDYDWTNFDFEADPQRMVEISEMLDATNPNLTRFMERGGKMLSYFGWADTGLNPMMAIDYFEQVEAMLGPKTREFFRLFMVPGMFHCRGGIGVDRFDALTPLLNWVERGVAPEIIIGSRVEDGSVTMTRPLCAYPKVARYKGTDSTNKAKSFICVDH